MTWLRRAGLRHFDAYAHHPYYGSRLERPTTVPKSKKSITLGNIRVLITRLNKLYGRSKRLWITEYGYQTKPPDPYLGVPPQKQATLLSLAAMRVWRLPRVTMLIQYLYRDEVLLSRFQTGLVYSDDKPKPSLQGFKLPFAEMSRSGFETVVWGQVRSSAPGRKPYRLEVLHKNVWQPVGHDRLTNNDGFFVRTIRLKRGALLRIWSPRQRRFSLRLRVR
jgi:hypothetical protein